MSDEFKRLYWRDKLASTVECRFGCFVGLAGYVCILRKNAKVMHWGVIL